MADSAPAPSPAAFLRGLGIAVIAGGFLALSGAFDSGGNPLIVRLVYWIPLMVIGGLWGHLCATVLGRRYAFERQPWLASGLLTAAIAGPLTVLVWALTATLFDPGPPRLETLPRFLLPVTVVTAAMTALNIFLGRTPVATHAAAPGAPPARFPDRLPPRLRGATLFAVQAEDHYLRIHTDRGTDLILMRLSDALTELEGLEGARTHRSWWVARDAVRDVVRGDGRAILTLDGGLTVPVSRRHARALREAGWY
ncbi:LytTR family DNA-binding domain-containing protein [uncultured Brevundimonas sp.]|uniref:LytTR family DNA-binding domain-containing protein n=1 Tax=uncultured Brevundimonas sp. TaxID=213418 RepID=UPI0030EF49DA|tara:strand:- start:3829 stop:4587 length:759 start_codon:yes stop_codon:yes gene_type:complete